MNGKGFNILIPGNVISDIEKKIDGIKKPEAAIKTAVNDTAKKARNLLVKKARRVYMGHAAERSNILSGSSIDKATVSKPASVLRFRSPVHEIKDFHVSSLTVSNQIRGDKTVYGNVLKGGNKLLEANGMKAFVVAFKNGHTSVVTRVPGTQMKKHPDKEQLRKLLSPSDKSMIGSEKVYGSSTKEIAQILNEQIQKIMNKILGGKI